jgi:hypothetical protein
VSWHHSDLHFFSFLLAGLTLLASLALLAGLAALMVITYELVSRRRKPPVVLMKVPTLMSAITRCRRVNSWLSSKRLFWALSGKAGGAVVETTIDHTLMRGSEPHDR